MCWDRNISAVKQKYVVFVETGITAQTKTNFHISVSSIFFPMPIFFPIFFSFKAEMTFRRGGGWLGNSSHDYCGYSNYNTQYDHDNFKKSFFKWNTFKNVRKF